jgi:Domain of unknown function (DUF4252)
MKRAGVGIVFAVASVLGAGLPAAAQSPQAPFPVTLEKQLAERASNYTEVSLDKKMLVFASRFMNDKDDEEGKRIVEKLNGVYVRSYEFDKPGQYTAADLDAVRRQFDSPEWSSLVKTRSRDGSDDADIYMKVVNDEVEGMFILDAESKELNFVYISGPIRPEDLKDLSGNFGIPSDAYEMSTKVKEKAQKKAEEKAQKSADKAQKEDQP